MLSAAYSLRENRNLYGPEAQELLRTLKELRAQGAHVYTTDVPGTDEGSPCSYRFITGHGGTHLTLGRLQGGRRRLVHLLERLFRESTELSLLLTVKEEGSWIIIRQPIGSDGMMVEYHIQPAHGPKAE